MLIPTLREFRTPGPTVAAMMASTARVVGIMGPQGGGKTTGVIAKVLRKAAMQPPSPADGIARYRCTVLMRSYRDLWSKVIPDWQEWVPQSHKAWGITWTGGRDNPAEQGFRFRALVDGQPREVRAEIWFRAIGELTPTEACKGIQTTDGWLPEASTASREMFEALFGRLGRYPRPEHGGAPLRQLFCDWNAADPYNWTTETFVYSLPENAAFFRQPGGRSPAAENLDNLPAGYYDDQIKANAHNPDWIKRMVDNEIGFVKDGKPVYGDVFDESRHVNWSGLVPWKGLPLIIAADAGLSPAILIGQRNSFGEWRVLDELVFEPGTGAQAAARALNRVLDSERYAGVPKPDTAWSDPAAKNPTETSAETEVAALRTWIGLMAEHTGLAWKPSRCGNNLEIRQEGVRTALRREVQGRTGLQIDGRRCPDLVAALARDYRFKAVRTNTRAGVEYHEKPDKGRASHVANGFEYLCANGGEQAAARTALETVRRLSRPKARPKTPRPGPVDPLARFHRRAS